MQWAVVTGGGSGIGLHYAYELAKKKYNIIIISNIESQNQQACHSISDQFGVLTDYYTIDLTLPNASNQVFEYTQKCNYEVEVLINNAGIFFHNSLIYTELEKSNALLQLQVTVPTLLCALYGKLMKERRKGYILNTASMTAWLPYPSIAIYASAKRYLVSFTKAFSLEIRDFGVHVCAVCPGAVDTNLYNLTPKLRKKARRLRIMISPEQMAYLGVTALFKGKVVYIPGCLNRFIVILAQWIPLSFINIIKRKLHFPFLE